MCFPRDIPAQLFWPAFEHRETYWSTLLGKLGELVFSEITISAQIHTVSDCTTRTISSSTPKILGALNVGV